MNLGFKQKQPEKKPNDVFGVKKPEPSSKPDSNKDLSNEINNLSRRLRMLEERYTNLRKKIQLTDQNMLHVDKKIINEIKSTNNDVATIRTDLTDVKDKMMLVVKELKSCAKSEDVKVLEKYVNMWQPVEFVTLNQLKDVVEQTIKRILLKKGIETDDKPIVPDFSAAHRPLEQKKQEQDEIPIVEPSKTLNTSKQ